MELNPFVLVVNKAGKNNISVKKCDKIEAHLRSNNLCKYVC